MRDSMCRVDAKKAELPKLTAGPIRGTDEKVTTDPVPTDT